VGEKMKLLFIRGDVDVHEAERLVSAHAKFYEANLGVVNGTSPATYVMPRESNRYEGYLRFVFPRREDNAVGSSSELHLYFSPRGTTPYRITFLYLDANGSVGFDLSGALWAHRVAVSLSNTGVLKKEIERAPWADPLDG
jgi:hypothetical protein